MTHGKVTRLAAVVAASAGSAQAKSWAVSLDVSEALAVVALLRLRAAG
jgi:homoserine acetyltransferase